MKITFVVGNWVNLSGGNRVIAIYAECLQKLGHQVLVVCPAKRKPSLYKQFRFIIKGHGRISLSQDQSSHFDNTDIPRMILEHGAPVTDADVPDADVVVATWWETAHWVANLSREKGAKAYFVQHYEVHDYFSQERKKMAAATYLLPLHKITISQWLVDLMRTRYDDTNVSLVPNSIDLEQFYSSPRGKQPIPTVGMMYHLAGWKGCDISVNAFYLAAQSIRNLKLVAFGHKQPAADFPLPAGTEFHYQPPQDNLRNIYASCDAWLFASRREGFGLPILEAMACRTPVIGTPVGAAPDLLGDDAGILVNPEDPEDMARAIIQICSMSDNEWQAMSVAAYSKATSYTWEDAANLFEKALFTAIERAKKGDF